MSVETEIQDVKRLLGVIGNQQIVTDMKVDKLAAVHEERMRGVEHRISGLERDAEDTGNYRIEELKKARDDAKSGSKWWQEKWFVIVGAIAMLFLNSCAAVGVAIAVAKYGGK